jgi:hypothetical protein
MEIQLWHPDVCTYCGKEMIFDRSGMDGGYHQVWKCSNGHVWRGELKISAATYKLPKNVRKLKHRLRTPIEWFWGELGIAFRHSYCQICRRSELNRNVDHWLQFNDPVWKDKDGVSEVCDKCEKANPEIFG